MTTRTLPDHSGDGLLLFNYTCDELGVDLACWFEYEAANLGARSRSGEQLEPDYPATWALWHVYLPGSGVDICPVLSYDVITAIEGWVAGQAEEEAAEREDETAYDKFMDWKDSQ